MIWRILLLWLLVANTAYGSVPGHRPVAYGDGVDYVQSCAARGRAVDATGLYYFHHRPYDPISCQWQSRDPRWNDRDPNGQTFCGGDPVQGTDSNGRCVENPPPTVYMGTAPVMQEYVETTTYFQNGTSATTGLPGQSDQMYEPAQVTGNSYNRVTMPTGWDFSYVSEHPLPANYGQTTTVPITQADVAMQQGDQYIKAVATLAAFDVGGEVLFGGDALAADESSIWRVGRHSDMPSPRPLGTQSHHGVNSVWMRDNYANYKASDAPAVLMRNDPSHNATRVVFNKIQAEIAQRQGVAIRDIDWSKVSPVTAWKISEEQFKATGTPEPVVDQYFIQFNDYLNSLK